MLYNRFFSEPNHPGFSGTCNQQYIWSYQGTPEAETWHLCCAARLHQSALAEKEF